MADLAGDSFGFGLGLQGKPETHAGIFEKAEELGFQKKKLKSDREKDIMSKLSVKAPAPRWNKYMTDASTDLLNTVTELKSKDKNWYNSPVIGQKMSKIKSDYEEMVRTLNDEKEARGYGMSHPDAVQLNQGYFQSAAKADQAGDLIPEYKKASGHEAGLTAQPYGTMYSQIPYDYGKEFAKEYKPTLSEKETPGGISGAFYYTKEGKIFDVEKNKDFATSIVESPNSRIGREAVNRYLPEVGGDVEKAKTKAIDELYKNLEDRAAIEDKTKQHQLAKDVGVGGERKAKVNVTYRKMSTGEDEITFSHTDIKDNVPMDFVDSNGNNVKGVPVSYKRAKGGNWELYVDVPQYEVITVEEDGAPGTKKIDKGIKRVKVDYQEAADRLRGEYNFDPEQIVNKENPEGVNVTRRESKEKKIEKGEKKVESLRSKYNY